MHGEIAAEISCSPQHPSVGHPWASMADVVLTGHASELTPAVLQALVSGLRKGLEVLIHTRYPPYHDGAILALLYTTSTSDTSLHCTSAKPPHPQGISIGVVQRVLTCMYSSSTVESMTSILLPPSNVDVMHLKVYFFRVSLVLDGRKSHLLRIPPWSATLRPQQCSAIAPCAAPRGARGCSCCGPCWKNGCGMFLAALWKVSYGMACEFLVFFLLGCSVGLGRAQ